MQKVFDRIGRERNENEYNRTEVNHRTDQLTNAAKRNTFNINSSYGIRILEKTDSCINKESYINELSRSID